MIGCAKTVDGGTSPQVLRGGTINSLENSKVLLFEGLFSELFRGEPNSPSRVYVSVCVHMCVQVRRVLETVRGRRSGGSAVWHVDFSSGFPQVQLLSRINL